MTTEETNLTSLIEETKTLEKLLNEEIEKMFKEINPESRRCAVSELGKMVRHSKDKIYDRMTQQSELTSKNERRINQMLRMLKDGKGYKEIAEELGLNVAP